MKKIPNTYCFFDGFVLNCFSEVKASIKQSRGNPLYVMNYPCYNYRSAIVCKSPL